MPNLRHFFIFFFLAVTRHTSPIGGCRSTPLCYFLNLPNSLQKIVDITRKILYNIHKAKNRLTKRRNIIMNGETRCAECGTYCQGWKDPTGRILCWQCFVKIWGTEPTRWNSLLRYPIEIEL
jgi:hypothetical protein